MEENTKELITKLKDVARLHEILTETEAYNDIYRQWDDNQPLDNYKEQFDVSREDFEDDYLNEYCWDDKIAELSDKYQEAYENTLSGPFRAEPQAPKKQAPEKIKILSAKTILISLGILALATLIFIPMFGEDSTDGFAAVIMFGIVAGIVCIVCGIIAVKNIIEYQQALHQFQLKYEIECEKYEKAKAKYELEQKETKEKREVYTPKVKEYGKEYEEYVEKLRIKFIKDVQTAHERHQDARKEMRHKHYCESPLGTYQSFLEDKYIPYASRLIKYFEREQAKTLNQALTLLDNDLAEEEHRSRMLNEERRKTEILQQEADARQEELERHNQAMESHAQAMEAQARTHNWKMEELAKEQARAAMTYDSTRCLSCKWNKSCDRKSCSYTRI